MKCISGTWFEFQHPNNREGEYWNSRCRQFSEKDWEREISEIASLGMEYIVLQNLSILSLDRESVGYGPGVLQQVKEAYYPGALFSFPEDFRCKNPLGVLLSACDKYGIRLFLPTGHFMDWKFPKEIMADKGFDAIAFTQIERIYALAAGHSSFYGWYYPDEACLGPDLPEVFVDFINRYSSFLRNLDATKKILIAPYGTCQIKADSHYIKQLEQTDVDIIAYQDGVGAHKNPICAVRHAFENLKKAHDKAGRSKIWADMEMFVFEGEPRRSPLIPAPIARIENQLKAISPYVEEVLCYQYQGLLAKDKGSNSLGPEEALKLYKDYQNLILK